VSVGCSGCGLTFSPSEVTTGVSGIATFTVTDAGGTNPLGSRDVLVSVDGNVQRARVTVRPVAGTITGDDTVSMGGARVRTVDLSVTGAGANASTPVPGVTVTGTGTGGLTVEGGVTNGRGRATLRIVASSGSSAGTLTFRADGVTHTMEVTP
jgi:hypothetical protein